MGINKSDDQVAHEKYSIINIFGIIATIIMMLMMMVTCTLPQQEEREQSGRSPLAKSLSAPGSPDHHFEYHDEDEY